MSKIYSCPIEVRGYELDSYDHVNNSVYLNYFEHARWKMLEEENVTLNTLDAWSRWPVLARVEVDYLKPTYMGDALIVTSQCTEMSRVAFTIIHEILRAQDVVARARVKVVMVNEKGRPDSIPEDFARTWKPA